jgi:alpha-glucosidase
MTDQLTIEQEGSIFRIFYNRHCFFTHTPQRPMMVLGKGAHTITDRKGVYRIKEKILQKIPLPTVSIEDSCESRIILTLKSADGSIGIKFSLLCTNDRISLNIEPNPPDSSINRCWLRLNARPDEAIYGCGEQFSELNLRGKNVPLWISEQGICRGDPKFHTLLLNATAGVGGNWATTYHAQPTFMSSENYYFHAESTVYAAFDFTHETYHDLYFWGIPNECFLGKFDDPLTTVGHLSVVLGRQPRLPAWLYEGMILAIQGKGGKEMVRTRLQKALDAGVKVNAIWSQDWEGIKVTSFGTQLFWDWKWDGGGRPVRFPEFPQFVQEMKARGIRYMGYINSFLNPDGDLYKIAHEKGYLVKKSDGTDYFIYVTTFPAALLDLTNPEAVRWMKDVIKTNVIAEAGLAGFMSDFGEYLPMDAVLHSGISAEVYHNRYPVDWQRLNLEAIQEAGKLGEVVFFTRSGYSHTSQYSTLIWVGDQLPTFSMDDGLASVIPAGLSLGICGVGYYHSDIGGYTTFQPFFKRNQEVFMRWAEHAAFTMVMRSHEGNRPEVNHQFDSDPDTLIHLGKMTRIHAHLKPYLESLSSDYQERGIPPMRALFLHYPQNRAVHRIKYEYLFGPDLLCAPVIKPHIAVWKVYIPGDVWIHLWSGKEFTPGWHQVPALIGQPPVFYRKGSSYSELFRQLPEV